MVVLTFQLHCGCFLKMEPAFQQYVFCHAIHSAHTLALVEESISLWLDNKTITLSPPGSRQSNSNCTFHRAEKRERHRKKDKEREGAKREKTIDSTAQQTESKADVQHKIHTRHIQVSSVLSVYNTTYLTPMVVNPIFFSTDLLLLMRSEWSISPSTPSERQHLQAHRTQAATVLLCIFIPCHVGQIHCAQWTPLLHIICPAH